MLKRGRMFFRYLRDIYWYVLFACPTLLQLDCCRPVEEIKERGLDLDLFVCLARCNSAAAELVRASEASSDVAPSGFPSSEIPTSAFPLGSGLAAFRRAVIAASRQGEGEFMVLSYSRKALGQTGDGHFSPLGGYHAGRDMVLILDVARFKYPPHWVPLSLLWRAMQLIDAETALPRGYVTLRRLASAPLLLFHMPAGAEATCSTSSPTLGGGGGSSSSSCSGSVPLVGPSCLNRRIHASLETGLKACRGALQAEATETTTGDRNGASIDLATAVRLFVTTLEGSTAAATALSSVAQLPLISSNTASAATQPDLLSAPTLSAASTAEQQPRQHQCHSSSCSSGGCAAPCDVAPAAASRVGGSAVLPSAPSSAASSPRVTAMTSLDVEEPRCVDKLSREHIGAAAALISDLEGSRLYPLVVSALRAHYGNATGALPPLQQQQAKLAAALSTPPAVDSFGDGADRATIILTSDDDAESGANNAVRAVASTSSTTTTAGPITTSAAALDVHASCDSHGMSCIRVRKSHVLTMLLLAFALRPASVSSSALVFPAASAEALLVQAVGQCIEDGSPLLRHEASVIRDQLRTANCSLLQ